MEPLADARSARAVGAEIKAVADDNPRRVSLHEFRSRLMLAARIVLFGLRHARDGVR